MPSRSLLIDTSHVLALDSPRRGVRWLAPVEISGMCLARIRLRLVGYLIRRHAAAPGGVAGGRTRRLRYRNTMVAANRSL